MPDHCPGAMNFRIPMLTIRKCPKCGDEVGTFSNDIYVKCSSWVFTIYNDIVSCISWCPPACECVGEETYRRLIANQQSIPGCKDYINYSLVIADPEKPGRLRV